MGLDVQAKTDERSASWLAGIVPEIESRSKPARLALHSALVVLLLASGVALVVVFIRTSAHEVIPVVLWLAASPLPIFVLQLQARDLLTAVR